MSSPEGKRLDSFILKGSERFLFFPALRCGLSCSQFVHSSKNLVCLNQAAKAAQAVTSSPCGRVIFFNRRAQRLDIINARCRYRGTSQEYSRFSKAMGIPQQRERVTVDGLGNIGAGKYTKAVAKSEKSGIIDSQEMFRKGYAHRRIGSKGQQIIDKPTYNKLTKDFRRNGGIIIRGEQAEKHLSKRGAYASYLPSLNAAVISDEATVSDVLEEMYHAQQDRTNAFGKSITDEVMLKREIDAQKYLLSVSKKYNIPDEETAVTKKNLEYYENQFKEKLGSDDNV